MPLGNPLVIRFGALGDTVILTVLIRALHARFGAPVDVLGSGAYTRDLLHGQPGVGQVHFVTSRHTPYLFNRPKIEIVQALRGRAPGPTWWGHVAGNSGLDLLDRAGWSRDLVCRASDCPGLPDDNFSDYLRRFAAMTPAAVSEQAPTLPIDFPAVPSLTIDAEMRSDLERWLVNRNLADRPLILVQAGNKRTMRPRLRSRRRASNTKYWPEADWAEVLRGLRESHPEHALLLLGVPNEASLNEDILTLAKVSDAYNVARELPLRRLMALAARADGLITVDSGPGHVAAAVGGAVVVLFGKANPTFYAPRGPGACVISLQRELEGEPSMLALTPRDVLDGWQRMRAAKQSCGAAHEPASTGILQFA